jgi:hypothetical protein
MRQAPLASIASALLFASLLAGAGCLQPGPLENETPDVPPPQPAPPGPIIFEGSSLLMQPLHAATCLSEGIDGENHVLPRRADGWWFFLEPAEQFVVYWAAGDDYLPQGSGESQGYVPHGATRAEVCRVEGTDARDYALTLLHPDHPDHPEQVHAAAQ